MLKWTKAIDHGLGPHENGMNTKCIRWRLSVMAAFLSTLLTFFEANRWLLIFYTFIYKTTTSTIFQLGMFAARIQSFGCYTARTDSLQLNSIPFLRNIIYHFQQILKNHYLARLLCKFAAFSIKFLAFSTFWLKLLRNDVLMFALSEVLMKFRL